MSKIHNKEVYSKGIGHGTFRPGSPLSTEETLFILVAYFVHLTYVRTYFCSYVDVQWALQHQFPWHFDLQISISWYKLTRQRKIVSVSNSPLPLRGWVCCLHFVSCHLENCTVTADKTSGWLVLFVEIALSTHKFHTHFILRNRY